MPPVAGRDVERVDVRTGEKIAEVAVGCAVGVAIKGVDGGLGTFAPFAHHVADCQHTRAGLAQENRQHLCGAAAVADDAQGDGGRRRSRIGARGGAGAGDGGECGGAQ